jgi:hypothetical protein
VGNRPGRPGIARARLSSLKKIPYLSAEVAEQAHLAARQSVASVRGDIAEALVRDLVAQVRHTQQTEQRLRQLLTEAFAALPASPHIQIVTIPGIGTATAAVLVAKSVDINRFATPAQFVSYFGIFPEEESSGVDKHGNPLPAGTPRMSRKGNDLVRHYLWNAARVAIVHNPAIRALYRRLKAKGKRPFLRPARKDGWVVVGRLRKDAALFSLPLPKPPSQPGPQATYGKERLSLAKRAGHQGGWQQVECVQYGETVTKTVKTFLATWHPAGGAIRAVLVQEDDGWVAFFCTKPAATAEEVLEAADRSALEQTNKDVKEVEGAGQQQVRNLHSSEGCFNLNLWLHSLVEAWAWDRPAEGLVNRCPWDREPRRPSHQDKRRALQRQVLQAKIDAAPRGRPTKGDCRALAQRLLDLAA